VGGDDFGAGGGARAAHKEFAAAAEVLASHELELSSVAATTVRTDAASGRVTTTDGPFLETKEAVGGYYLVEAADLDEVIALTQLLPEVHASHSGVEIRQVVGHG
jgi:hypothetical protein